MDIDFTNNYLVNDNDVTFFATVDKQQTVACIVSKAALDELLTADDDEDTEELFLAYQYKFEEIAEAMIRNHQVVDGEIHIIHAEL